MNNDNKHMENDPIIDNNTNDHHHNHNYHHKNHHNNHRNMQQIIQESTLKLVAHEDNGSNGVTHTHIHNTRCFENVFVRHIHPSSSLSLYYIN
jgi:hypothetical protein